METNSKQIFFKLKYVWALRFKKQKVQFQNCHVSGQQQKLSLFSSSRPCNMDALSETNDTFALCLLKILCEDNISHNVFFSPLSISSALAMVFLGAKGNTAAQMSQVNLPTSCPREGAAFLCFRLFCCIITQLYPSWEDAKGQVEGSPLLSFLGKVSLINNLNINIKLCPSTLLLFRTWYWNYLKSKLLKPNLILGIKDFVTIIVVLQVIDVPVCLLA